MTLLLVSCYEDKGNYDYKDIERLEIKTEKNYINTTFGEVVEITPEYSQDVVKNAANYEFEWSLNGKTRDEWKNKDFKWTVDVVIPEAKLILKVKDLRNDMVYMKRFSISITGIYENDYSWMILSDNGGKSQLSFLSVIEVEDGDEMPQESEQLYFKKQKFIPNVFDGELGSGPIAIQEHFREGIDWKDKVVGNVCIFQESGAVDLEGVNFIKEIDMSQAFVGGVYPNGPIYPGTFMDAVDVVLDKDGKLYSRVKLSTSVYNSDYFLPEPLVLPGEESALEKCMVCRGFYRENRFGLQVLYDGKNKRFLYIKDKGEDWGSIKGAGQIIPVDVDKDMSTKNIVPLDNHEGYELMYISQFETGDVYDYGFFEVLRKEADDKLYVQHFVSAVKGWGQPRKVSEIVKREIKGLPAVPDHIAFPIYAPQENAFFAVGENLYRLDLQNREEPVELYYSFDSKITAINCQGKRNLHLAVGLEDGSFFVLGINHAKNIKDEHKVVYTAPEKVGRIVDIKYKDNDHWNY